MFLAKQYQQLLSRHQLADFDQFWEKKIGWFEEPNYKRGGWSGVGQLMLGEQQTLNIFIKKQKHYNRRTLFHPIVGEPTFRREFKSLQFLNQQKVNAAKVVFYDEKNMAGNECAILVTEALTGYESLDKVLEKDFIHHRLPFAERRQLIKSVALFIRRFHDTGLQHRALFPKHIFVKKTEGLPEISLIDLEKSRFSLYLVRRAYYDLVSLHRHTHYLSKTERLYFLLQYFKQTKLNAFTKAFCRKLLKRCARKHSP